MNKDQVGEDVTLWPLELCFCCFPKLFFFLEQRNNVVEKWVPATLGKQDSEADKGDKDNCRPRQ